MSAPGLLGGEGGACDDGVPLVSSVQARAYAACVPLNATIEVTLRCNLRCVHCYNFDRDEPKERHPCGDQAAPELSTEEIVDAIRQLHAAGCLFLTLTGGELFSHPDLFTFLDEAKRLHLAVQLLSNGTLLRPGVVARLAAYPNIVGASLSLYGATAAVHDGVTQMEGSFRRTWDGAERLRKKGMAVRLKFIVMRQNAHEVAEMRRQASERGFPYMVDLVVTARHDGTSGSLGARVDREQLEALYRGPLADLVPKGRRPVTEEAFPCNCARANCAISSRGDVLPCVSVPMAAGNIRRQPFAEIWRSSTVFRWIRELRMADYPQCAPCTDKDWCTRSRGAALTASGSYTGVDPFVCESAALARRLHPRG